PAVEPPPPRPTPGIDLAGPIPLPDRRGPRLGGAIAMTGAASAPGVLTSAVPDAVPGAVAGPGARAEPEGPKGPQGPKLRKVIDLAADRAVVPVAVPAPPSGGSVGFTFADDRPGWVARIPEHLQLPAVAYGAGRVYVSGGFESVSFYALDAETGRIEW